MAMLVLGETMGGFHRGTDDCFAIGCSCILAPLLLEPQPEVWAAAIFSLGTVLDIGFDTSRDGLVDEDCNADEKFRDEAGIVKSLLSVVSDGSPLVQAKYNGLIFSLSASLSRFAFGHNKHLKSVDAAYWKPQSNSVLTSLPSFVIKGSGSGHTTPTHYMPQGSIVSSTIAPSLRVGNESQSVVRDGRVSTSSPLATPRIIHGSPLSDDSSQHSDFGMLNDCVSNGCLNRTTPRPLDNALYLQCVLAMCTLAKDPSPRVASLGRQVLSIIGIEQVAAAKSVKSGGGSVRTGESTSTPNPSLAGLARSSSWFELNGGIIILGTVIFSL
ncbi:Regulatory-associated protein of TOR 2 [Forsythia ovata]|uniref:Regulatory-associated protein of TOR 2 n=1 Tax=Forsythia ovata TaxID=205694 RepID=A0ABD1TPN4_9LAMI